MTAVDLDLTVLRAGEAPAPDGPFRMLVVCTGNICRSAFAAAYFSVALGNRLPLGSIAVDSAGTDVGYGIEMPAPIARAIRSVGASPAVHVITPLDGDAIDGADLIVTMTRRQRAEVARRSPRAAARVVTLKQLARLCQADAGGDPPPAEPSDADAVGRQLRKAAAAAIGRRGLTAALTDDDIADPWQKGDEAYAVAIAEIRTAVAVVRDYLLAATGAPE